MNERFGEKLDLSIYTNDSEEARSYALNASTTVLVEGEVVSLDTAMSEWNMEDFLNRCL